MKPAATQDVRVAVLCCDGPYQRELVWRTASRFQLVGVVRQETPQAKGSLWTRLKRYRDPRRLVRQLQARWLLPRQERQAEPLRQTLFPARTATVDAPVVVTRSINSPEVVQALEQWKPDLVLVNGTQLLREPVLALIKTIPLGMINLHTGLSPYSRGGNCNLFMLLEGRPELIGLTVHHIDAGIDSGEIILSKQLELESDDNYEMIDIRCFDQGIELLLEGARRLAAGEAERVAQWEEGKLFLRKTGYVYEPWHRLQAARMLQRGILRDYLNNRAQRDADAGVRVIGTKQAQS